MICNFLIISIITYSENQHKLDWILHKRNRDPELWNISGEISTASHFDLFTKYQCSNSLWLSNDFLYRMYLKDIWFIYRKWRAYGEVKSLWRGEEPIKRWRAYEEVKSLWTWWRDDVEEMCFFRIFKHAWR